MTILRVLGIVRWLAWGWMVAVVAFSGDAVRHPVVAWLSVAAGLALADGQHVVDALVAGRG